MSKTLIRKALPLIVIFFQLTILSCENSSKNQLEKYNKAENELFRSLTTSVHSPTSFSLEIQTDFPDQFVFDESGWVIGTEDKIDIVNNEGAVKNKFRYFTKVTLQNMDQDTDYFVRAYIKSGSEFFYSKPHQVNTKVKTVTAQL